MTDQTAASPGAPRRTAFLCGTVWLLAFVTTHIPAQALPLDAPGGDKALHLNGYLILTALFVVTLKRYGVALWRRVTVALGVMAVYAAFDELTQPLFNRSTSFGDWVADLVGAVTAVLACEAVFRAKALKAPAPAPGDEE